NGVAEHMNRTIVEMALSFLKDAGLPKTYWGYAVLYAVYIINRTPTSPWVSDAAQSTTACSTRIRTATCSLSPSM
ncbi:hypothetical protein AX14_011010, partial [Amanita brunnescens Koide BX004]